MSQTITPTTCSQTRQPLYNVYYSNEIHYGARRTPKGQFRKSLFPNCSYRKLNLYHLFLMFVFHIAGIEPGAPYRMKYPFPSFQYQD